MFNYFKIMEEAKETNKESENKIQTSEGNISSKNEKDIKNQEELKNIEKNLSNIKEEEKEENKSINKEEEKVHEKSNDLKENQKKDDEIDPHLIFQKELLNIINKQEKILSSTSTINEKFGVSNEITKEQIMSFKTNIDKYGKYLLMIKKELGIISSTMQKIKKLAKEKDNKIQK